MSEISLVTLQGLIGYRFKDESLLLRAITHSSYANERTEAGSGDYERLEFLGDAVLELATSDFLYKRYPEKPEGWLTRKRASLVNEKALAYCARKWKLQEFIRFGRGDIGVSGKKRDSIVSDVSEAIIGAIYLDGGFAIAREYVERFALQDIEERVLVLDAKTSLQELVQGHLQQDISYRFVCEDGPEHDKTFTMEVLLGDEVMGCGKGHSKKDAEQEAAYQGILKLYEKYPRLKNIEI